MEEAVPSVGVSELKIQSCPAGYHCDVGCQNGASQKNLCVSSADECKQKCHEWCSQEDRNGCGQKITELAMQACYPNTAFPCVSTCKNGFEPRKLQFRQGGSTLILKQEGLICMEKGSPSAYGAKCQDKCNSFCQDKEGCKQARYPAWVGAPSDNIYVTNSDDEYACHSSGGKWHSDTEICLSK